MLLLSSSEIWHGEVRDKVYTRGYEGVTEWNFHHQTNQMCVLSACDRNQFLSGLLETVTVRVGDEALIEALGSVILGACDLGVVDAEAQGKQQQQQPTAKTNKSCCDAREIVSNGVVEKRGKIEDVRGRVVLCCVGRESGSKVESADGHGGVEGRRSLARRSFPVRRGFTGAPS